MKRRVLIVDDESDERALAATVLREALPGANVLEIADALAFAEQLAGLRPDVAVVARELGWADGLELLTVLHRQHPSCVTVLIGDTRRDLVEPDAQPDAHLSRTTKGIASLGRVVVRASERRARVERALGAPGGLDSLPLPVLRLSAEERVVAVNSAANALFSIEHDRTLIGRSMGELFTDASGEHATVSASLAASLKSGLEVIVRRPGALECRCRLLLRAELRDGVLGGFVAVLVTSDLAPAAERGASRDEVGPLLYAVSHDLQQPIQTTAQSVEQLARKLRAEARLSDDEERIIRRILSGTGRMQSLVDGLLAYARTGRRPLEPEAVALERVVDEVVQGLQPDIERSKASIRWSGLPEVIAGRAEITQLMQNLIANAIKFRGEDPPVVEIACAERGEHWMISVRDNGIGIEPEHAERIFEPFQRLHSESEYPGTGVGLAVCRKICQRHGGRIWVVPNAERGSTFYATIRKFPHNDQP